MDIQSQDTNYEGTTVVEPGETYAGPATQIPDDLAEPGYAPDVETAYAVTAAAPQGYDNADPHTRHRPRKSKTHDAGYRRSEETGKVQVKATLPDGTGIPGLLFQLHDFDGITKYAEGYTDADGVCTLDGAPRGSHVRLSYPRRHEYQGRTLLYPSDHLHFDLLTDIVLQEVSYRQPRLFGRVNFAGPWEANTAISHLTRRPEIRVELLKNGDIVAQSVTNSNLEFSLTAEEAGHFLVRLQGEVQLGPYLAVCHHREFSVFLPADGCLTLEAPIRYNLVPGMVVGQIAFDTLPTTEFTITSTDLITGMETPVNVDTTGCFRLRALGPVALTFPARLDLGGTTWNAAPGRPLRQTLLIASEEVKIADTMSYLQVTPVIDNAAHGKIVGRVDGGADVVPVFYITSTDLATGQDGMPVQVNNGTFQFIGTGPHVLHFPPRLKDADGRLWDIAPNQSLSQTFMLAAGDVRIADIVSYRQVTPQAGLQQVRWVVTDSHDQPVQGAMVKLCDPTRTQVYDWKLTSADGSCLLQPVQSGPQTILVYRNARETGEPLVTDITI